jgi:hypothetical protein
MIGRGMGLGNLPWVAGRRVQLDTATIGSVKLRAVWKGCVGGGTF